jgi:hypothetical protein
MRRGGAKEASMRAPGSARAGEPEVLVGDERGCHYEADGDEEFARWLKEEYVPLAGAWHY